MNEAKIKNIIKEKERLKRKFGERCVYCGCTNTLLLTIDHKVPLVRGGQDIESNKQIVCFICNQLKGALTDKEFSPYYKALAMMKKLYKVKLVIPTPKLEFKEHHYPDFEYEKNEGERNGKAN